MGFINILRGLSNHERCVYIFLVTLILCIFSYFNLELKHVAEITKIKTECSILKTNYDSLVEEQNKVIVNQQNKLEEAQMIGNMQHNTIERLINYLKSLNEWPPDIRREPIDPNKI